MTKTATIAIKIGDRTHTDSSTWSQIADATNSTYQLTENDIGQYIRYTFSFFDDAKNPESLYAQSYVKVYSSDIFAPFVSSFTPADEASGIAIASDIVITFNEAIARGTGNIVLKTSAGTTVASYDVATSSNLSISGSALIINPSVDLDHNTGYKVEFAAGSIKDIAGNAYAGTTNYNFTTQSSPKVSGTSGNDTLTGGAGIPIDGLAGIDTVSYMGNHGTIGRNANDTWSVGTEILTNIERLQFTDKKIALDLTPDGNAGQAMAFIGLIAPSLLNNTAVRGTIISLFDQGNTMEQLCQLALDLNLAPKTSNTDLANSIYQNVIGDSASQDMTNALVGYIESHSQANFLATVAGMHINVDLVGLQQTGIEYTI